MSRKSSRHNRNKARIRRLYPLAGLVATGLATGMTCAGFAAAQSKYYPTYHTGAQGKGEWVVGDGQIITPAGTQAW